MAGVARRVYWTARTYHEYQFTLRVKSVLDTPRPLGYPSSVDVRFEDDDLDRLETDPSFTGGYAAPLITSFRKKMQFIRGAQDERDFYSMRSARFERLKGQRDHQYSMRLNDQWRLILEFDGKHPNKIAVIIGIEDYH